MKLKDVVSYFENTDKTPFEEFMVQSDELADYLSKMSQKGKEVILSSGISEERLVKFFHAVRAKLVSSMVNQGFQSLLLCELEGDLRTFSDTMILTIIGAFADEEII